MSRDPGESPDEDGEPDDQRPDQDTTTESSSASSSDKGANKPTETVDSAAEDSEVPPEKAADTNEQTDPEAEEGATDGKAEARDVTEPDGEGGDSEIGDREEEAGKDDAVDDTNDDDDDGEAADDDEDSGGEAEDDDEGEEPEDEEDDGNGEYKTKEPDEKPDTTPIQRKTGPAEDQEQPLTEHIEEMVKRVAIVLVFAGLVSLLAFPFGEEFINFLWYSILPSDISKPHIYHPLELIITQLKAASLLGVVLALPIFVYQTYAFMRPGLYPHERRYYLAAVPTSLVLAFVGLLFGYFLVLPAVMTYFMQYSRDVVDIAFALGDTFTLMLVLLGFLAVVFQIPLFIMLAIMMGLTTRTWLEERRLIMWGVFLGIAFLFSPDPTGMAPFLIALTMIGLFEGTLLLLRWTGRGN